MNEQSTNTPMSAQPTPKKISFSYVEVSEETKAIMQIYREEFQRLYDKISSEVPSSRGRALCLTNLEEASMWLNKGLTNNS